MILKHADEKNFPEIRDFYRDLIDAMHDKSSVIGWKKGIYPSDTYLSESIERHELYIYEKCGTIAASVILNSETNEGYRDVLWETVCKDSEVLVPHALAVGYDFQGTGIAMKMLSDIVNMASINNMKAVRLDVLSGNTVAERLYTKFGFRLITEKEMFYEDTGLTSYKLYEYRIG